MENGPDQGRIRTAFDGELEEEASIRIKPSVHIFMNVHTASGNLA